MKLNSKIYVAGHRGLVGSAILRRLENDGYTNLVYRTSKELDLRDKAAVDYFFASEKPEYVFLAAAKVGGIVANNDFPADFIRDNLMIQTNVIDASYRNDVTKLLFLGSTCIYPKLAPQPLKEEYLLTGPLEPTNDAYALAKISGIKMCQSYNKQYGTTYISAMPTNLYGENDNFDLQSSHVLPALIRKFHEAKEKNKASVEIWGTGTPKREFLYSDDLADACLFLMQHYNDDEIINIGVGEDVTIRELAETIREVVGFEGELMFDTSKPDGTPRKLVDTSKINELGWSADVGLQDGVHRAYNWYLENMKVLNKA
ncbi:GDP-L-fucose synthase [Exiguobacterium chiriqhucha]|uniref:GDP-L-fucose synthase n=1 Tax=Exiguobacterium chiriqhucha TaxID=1385984 RepID=UPI000494FFFF|nr:GDP-L-fucose synthase [Exiguobacterium chiriqhucha]